jgi:hypothetical protein
VQQREAKDEYQPQKTNHHNARENAMNEHDRPSRAAHETFNKATAAGEDTTRGMQKSIATTVGNVRDLNVKLIGMARQNAEATFDLAQQLASVEAPSDLTQVWSTHARKQFEMLTEQAKELTSLGQRLASSNMEPLARNVGQAFRKAS